MIEATGQIFIFLSICTSIVYGSGWFAGGDLMVNALIKGSAVGFLALFVLTCARSANHGILFFALVASVAGDIFLALQGETNFLKGLGSFLVAQLFFITLYLKNRLPLREVTSLRTGTVSLLWAAGGISLYFMYPYLGDRLVPVFVYASTLILMATTALLSQFPLKLVGLGAILFIVSDSLLGARMVTTLPDYTGSLVWITYYLAELFMALGVILLPERRAFSGGYRFD